MKRKELRRRRLAWILLMVFVPMMALSAFHTHEASHDLSAGCAECLQHLHHSHLNTADYHIDHCVLCQLMSVPFVAAAIISIGLHPYLIKTKKAVFSLSPTSSHGFRLCGRAPPGK